MAERLLDARRIFWSRPVASRVNFFHQLIDAGLARRRPLGVVLAHDLGRISKDIGHILKTATAPQKLGCERVPEPVRVPSAPPTS
jgi:hypothetical protein